VDQVPGAADKAVYAAKNSGRDRVCAGNRRNARGRHPSAIRPGRGLARMEQRRDFPLRGVHLPDELPVILSQFYAR
jgi:hypothetical protein